MNAPARFAPANDHFRPRPVGLGDPQAQAVRKWLLVGGTEGLCKVAAVADIAVAARDLKQRFRGEDVEVWFLEGLYDAEKLAANMPAAFSHRHLTGAMFSCAPASVRAACQFAHTEWRRAA